MDEGNGVRNRIATKVQQILQAMIRANRIEMARNVYAIINRYHEPGNHRRSLRKVWQHYVYPIYPMSLRTMMELLRIAREHQSPGEIPPGLYPLFEGWDKKRTPYTI